MCNTASMTGHAGCHCVTPAHLATRISSAQAHPPLLSPQPAHNALDYANLLPPDVRHAVFRHWCGLRRGLGGGG